MQKSKGHSYSQEQVDTLQLMLDATGVAPLVKLRKILQYAVQEGIAAYQDNIMADKFLVHPENRGTLLLDVYKMHANGGKVKASGAEKNKCDDSIAFVGGRFGWDDGKDHWSGESSLGGWQPLQPVR